MLFRIYLHETIETCGKQKSIILMKTQPPFRCSIQIYSQHCYFISISANPLKKRVDLIITQSFLRHNLLGLLRIAQKSKVIIDGVTPLHTKSGENHG
jgi:hypothetical protein